MYEIVYSITRTFWFCRLCSEREKAKSQHQRGSGDSRAEVWLTFVSAYSGAEHFQTGCSSGMEHNLVREHSGGHLDNDLSCADTVVGTRPPGKGHGGQSQIQRGRPFQEVRSLFYSVHSQEDQALIWMPSPWRATT